MAAALAVLALVYFPLELLIACALLLVVTLVWRSRSRRAGGSGLMPIAVVWGTVGALVLSVGAVAVRSVIPGLETPSAASAPAVRLGPEDQTPDGSTSTSSPGASPASTIAVQSAEAAQHLTQASVPQAPAPQLPLAGGAGSGAASSSGAAASAPQPASSGAGASAAQPAPSSAPAAATGPSNPAPSSSAPASSAPAPSSKASPTPSPSKDCVAPLDGVVTVKLCS